MTTFAEGLICERWPLQLPDFRVAFHAERPKWEIGRLEHMDDRVGEGMVVYDVGAEHGDFTALYRSWGAEVVPIEPAEAYWPCIRQTFEANGFAPPPAWFRGFAADVPLRDRIVANYGRASWPRESVGEVVPDPGFLHLAHSHFTPRIRLDELAQRGPAPDVLTIDVEGAEWHVLNGAWQLLRSGSLQVYVSVHEHTMGEWYSRTLDDLHGLMESCGYAGEQLPHNGEGETFWFYERRPA